MFGDQTGLQLPRARNRGVASCRSGLGVRGYGGQERDAEEGLQAQPAKYGARGAFAQGVVLCGVCHSTLLLFGMGSYEWQSM